MHLVPSSVNVRVFQINKSPQATAAVLGETLNYCIKLPTQLFPSKTVGLVQRRVLCATAGRRAANAESSKKPSSSKENKDMQEPLKVCVNQPAEVWTLLKLRKPTASFKRLQPPKFRHNFAPFGGFLPPKRLCICTQYTSNTVGWKISKVCVSGRFT